MSSKLFLQIAALILFGGVVLFLVYYAVNLQVQSQFDHRVSGLAHSSGRDVDASALADNMEARADPAP
jgi:hypothetical protein